MARAYSTSNQPSESLRLIQSAVYSGFALDSVALAITFSACRKLGRLSTAMEVHGFVIKGGYEIDPFVSTELIGVYGDNGELSLARRLFNEIPVRNVVVWNAIVQQYIKHGFLEKAEELFGDMMDRDVVSWNTMISGFCRAGLYAKAVALFHEIKLSKMKPNEVTMRIVLSACSELGALDTGIWVHVYIERNGMNLNGNLDHCLVDMYSKCGSIEKALQVFEKIPLRRDLYSWTSIICGLAMHGRANDALGKFSQMQEMGIRPDEVTLVGVLGACAHGGLFDQGYHYFRSMKDLYGISPKIEHYGCMVDLLGRVGLLKEACLVIKEMPMKPNGVVWGSLLNGCKVHNNSTIGEIAAAKLVELDPRDHWARVMMSNLYADDCNWSGVIRMRKEMRGVGLKKTPGCSSIEVNGEVHEFVAGGTLHQKYANIRNMLGIFEVHVFPSRKSFSMKY
ncbi:uncharacterized protein A4U43_C07F37320 [Asparagus officinalis]|uniref:DYW domain-containing protein n=2 Tax=Asparagus officinalis TaxID=4686 RepID=A0A5P1EHP5_ASPOF|nr:uncharacterized protein A4U43_C07F37320 [Asparagus officinalis]